jgi:hypothetical protein
MESDGPEALRQLSSEQDTIEGVSRELRRIAQQLITNAPTLTELGPEELVEDAWVTYLSKLKTIGLLISDFQQFYVIAALAMKKTLEDYEKYGRVRLRAWGLFSTPGPFGTNDVLEGVGPILGSARHVTSRFLPIEFELMIEDIAEVFHVSPAWIRSELETPWLTSCLRLPRLQSKSVFTPVRRGETIAAASTLFQLSFDASLPAEKALTFLLELTIAIRQKGGYLSFEPEGTGPDGRRPVSSTA